MEEEKVPLVTTMRLALTMVQATLIPLYPTPAQKKTIEQINIALAEADRFYQMGLGIIDQQPSEKH